MAFVLTTCPHCSGQNMALTVVARTFSRDGFGIAHLQCPACHMPSAAVFGSKPGWSGEIQRFTEGQGTDILKDLQLQFLRLSPPPAKGKAPEHVPEAVARVFIQAIDAHSRSQNDTASMGYRKSLDIALKAFDASIKGDFYKRIEALAASGALTPALQDWAHEVRLLGNEGAHELEEPTAEDVADLAALTQSTLEYLFTMPKRVEERRAKRAAAKAKA